MPDWAGEAREALWVRRSMATVPVGFVKENETLRNYFAVCKKAGHGRCVRSRTYVEGRSVGSGQPLGFLTAWLLYGSEASGSKEEHMQFIPSAAQRRECRNLAKNEWNYEAFHAREKVTEPGDSEPDVVPNR